MFTSIKKFMAQGSSSQYDEETNRRIIVVNLFAAVGMSVTFFLGLTALGSNDYPLAIILLVSSAIFALSQQIQVRNKTAKGRVIAMSLLLGCLMMLMAILTITGGSENTGPLWIYTVPPVTMFFAGFQRGLLATVLFTLLICILLFMPNDALLLASYTMAFKSRLILSFMTVTFLSAFYEYSRQKSYDTAVYLSEQFERQAQHDPLTHLLNRRGVQQRLDREEGRSKRNEQAFCVALADIDRFKSVNDKYGHKGGDEVLKRVSQLFNNRLRKHDTVARWGGEEFLFIFPETSEHQASLVVEEIRAILEDSPMVLDGKTFKVTSSFGICEVSKDVELDKALSLADQAMYRAKSDGRNRVFSASNL